MPPSWASAPAHKKTATAVQGRIHKSKSIRRNRFFQTAFFSSIQPTAAASVQTGRLSPPSRHLKTRLASCIGILTHLSAPSKTALPTPASAKHPGCRFAQIRRTNHLLFSRKAVATHGLYSLPTIFPNPLRINAWLRNARPSPRAILMTTRPRNPLPKRPYLLPAAAALRKMVPTLPDLHAVQNHTVASLSGKVPPNGYQSVQVYRLHNSLLIFQHAVRNGKLAPHNCPQLSGFLQTAFPLPSGTGHT